MIVAFDSHSKYMGTLYMPIIQDTNIVSVIMLTQINQNDIQPLEMAGVYRVLV